MDEDDWNKSRSGNLAVHDAALIGNLNIVKQLVEKHSLDVNAPNDDGRSPLYLACWAGQPHVVHWLCENGALVDQATSAGWTPIFAAAERGHDEVVSELLSNGCDTEHLSDDGACALYHACAKVNERQGDFRHWVGAGARQRVQVDAATRRQRQWRSRGRLAADSRRSVLFAPRNAASAVGLERTSGGHQCAANKRPEGLHIVASVHFTTRNAQQNPSDHFTLVRIDSV